MKPTHTHELRSTIFRDYDFVKEQKQKYNLDIDLCYTETIIQGTPDECHAEVVRLAEEQGCGTGLLYNNGGYHIINMETERLNKIKEAGPEMLDALKEISNAVGKGIPMGDIQEMTMKAIKKATA